MTDEQWYQTVEREACEKITAALLLPLPVSEYLVGLDGDFDPWDLFPSLYGSYSGEFDKMAIEVLTDILNGKRRRDDLAADIFREMLCIASLCDYGASPRVCFPTQPFREILPDLIAKWRAVSLIRWGEDVTKEDDAPDITESAEIERLRSLLGRYTNLVGDCEGTDFLGVASPDRRGAPGELRSDITTDEALEIRKYGEAAVEMKPMEAMN